MWMGESERRRGGKWEEEWTQLGVGSLELYMQQYTKIKYIARGGEERRLRAHDMYVNCNTYMYTCFLTYL